MNSLPRLEELRAIRERQSIDPRAQHRRQLYREDPMWRLTKLKANRETRMRAKINLMWASAVAGNRQ